jgi:hypothetical protein
MYIKNLTFSRAEHSRTPRSYLLYAADSPCGPLPLDITRLLLENIAVFLYFSSAPASPHGTVVRISLRLVSQACCLLDSRSRILLVFHVSLPFFLPTPLTSGAHILHLSKPP